MLDHVSPFMDLTSLDLRAWKFLADHARQCFGSVDDEQRALFGIQPTVDQVLQQRFADRNVLGCSLPESQTPFSPIARDAQSDDNAMTVVQVVERPTR